MHIWLAWKGIGGGRGKASSIAGGSPAALMLQRERFEGMGARASAGGHLRAKETDAEAAAGATREWVAGRTENARAPPRQECFRLDTLRELLYDTEWLERKLHSHGVRSVLDDFRRYLLERSDPQVHTVGRAFELSAKAALAHPSLSLLGVQMAGRLMAHCNQPLIPDWIVFIRALLDEEPYSQGAVPLWPLTASLGQVGGGNLATLKGHDSWVTGIAVSPDGSWVATSSKDRTVRVWDLLTGESMHVLSGHADNVSAVCSSPDGQRLVTSSRDGTARVWDVLSGAELVLIKGHEAAVNCCAVFVRPAAGPEQWRQLVATGSDDMTARVWNLNSGAPVFTLEGHRGKIRAVAAARDGSFVVTGSDDAAARVWCMSSGAVLHELRGHGARVSHVELVCGGTAGVLTLSSDRTARLWDAGTGECLHVLEGHQDVLGGVAVLPDGSRAVTVSGDKTARVWDLASGECEHVLTGHRNWVNGVATYAGGRRGITVSVDCHARIWDLDTGHCITTLQGHNSLVAGVAVTPDERMAITISSDRTARIWSLVDSLPAFGCGHTGRVSAIAVLPEGDRCVSVGHDGMAALWDCSSGLACRNQIEGPPGAEQVSLGAVCASGDGGSIAAAAGSDVWLWDLGFLALKPQLVHVLRGHSAAVTAVALSHRGEMAASASEDRTVRLWEADSGSCQAILRHPAPVSAVLILHTSPATAGVPPDECSASPAQPRIEAVATASADNIARVWDPHNGALIASLTGHTDKITCLVEGFSSQGEASCGFVTASRDMTLCAWAKGTGTPDPESDTWWCQMDFCGHSSAVTAAAVVRGASGARVVSGSADGTVMVWSMASGVQLHAVDAHTGPVHCLSTATSGKHNRPGTRPGGGPLVLSCGEDGCAALWDPSTACRVGLFSADAPLLAGGLSALETSSGSAAAVVGDAHGRLHFLQLPRR